MLSLLDKRLFISTWCLVDSTDLRDILVWLVATLNRLFDTSLSSSICVSCFTCVISTPYRFNINEIITMVKRIMPITIIAVDIVKFSPLL